jgi:hypothetical protein
MLKKMYSTQKESSRSFSFFSLRSHRMPRGEAVVWLCVFALVVNVCVTSEVGISKYKLFGLGLSKTGTTTLGAALTQLGYENVHFDPNLVPFLFEDRHAYNFSHRYDSVDSVEDLPVALYYEEMLREYPNARFVLTIRDPAAWYQSYRSHLIDHFAMHEGHFPFRQAMLGELAYGSNNPDDKDTWIAHFNNHNARVQEIIPADQLLVIDITATNGTSFWRTICKFLQRERGPCAKPDSTTVPFSNAHEERKKNVARLVRFHRENNFPTVESPSHFGYVSVITLDASLISDLLGRHIRDRFYLFHSFIATVEALRDQGVTHDVILLIYGTAVLPRNFGRAIFKRLRVYCYHFHGAVGSMKRTFAGKHEEFGWMLAEFLRAKIHILRLTQYSRLLYFDATTRLSRGCDALLDTMHGNFSVYRGMSTEAPFDSRAFLITPSKQAYYDLYDVAATKHFSIEHGWLEVGSIPQWGPADHLKRNWEFARSSQDVGLLYYYYFRSPARRYYGNFHVSTIATESWEKCVLSHLFVIPSDA